jgi:protein pelota
MKFQAKQIEKDGSGRITLIAEEGEDLWHCYNLLAKGDRLKATAMRLLFKSYNRSVVIEGSTGSVGKTIHKTTLTIAVDSLFFDVQVNALRVNGRNAEENKYVKVLHIQIIVRWVHIILWISNCTGRLLFSKNAGM